MEWLVILVNALITIGLPTLGIIGYFNNISWLVTAGFIYVIYNLLHNLSKFYVWSSIVACFIGIAISIFLDLPMFQTAAFALCVEWVAFNVISEIVVIITLFFTNKE